MALCKHHKGSNAPCLPSEAARGTYRADHPKDIMSAQHHSTPIGPSLLQCAWIVKVIGTGWASYELCIASPCTARLPRPRARYINPFKATRQQGRCKVARNACIYILAATFKYRPCRMRNALTCCQGHGGCMMLTWRSCNHRWHTGGIAGRVQPLLYMCRACLQVLSLQQEHLDRVWL
jgi:hypothetical protein